MINIKYILNNKMYKLFFTILLALFALSCKDEKNINFYFQAINKNLGIGTHTVYGCFTGEFIDNEIKIKMPLDLNNVFLTNGELYGWRLVRGEVTTDLIVYHLPDMKKIIVIPEAESISAGGANLVILFANGFSVQTLDQLTNNKIDSAILPFPEGLAGEGFPAYADDNMVVFGKEHGVLIYNYRTQKIIKHIEIVNKFHWPGRFIKHGSYLFWVNITGERLIRMDLKTFKHQEVAAGSEIGLAIIGEQIFLIDNGRVKYNIDTATF